MAMVEETKQPAKTSTKKKKKIGPYDPKVYHAIEEIRKEVEETTKVLQQMSPEEDQKQVKELEKQAMDLEKAVDPDEPPPMVCPFHIELLVNMPNRKGYDLLKCPSQPCLISVVGKDQAEEYMKGAYEGLHKDVENRWHSMNCYCGFPPALRQSHSEKNAKRMYLCCRNKPADRCRFFRWADEPLEETTLNGLDYMVCPKHLTRLEHCKSRQGWEYMKCPSIPCFLMCGKDKASDYMKAVYQNIHPDICDRWEKLNCFCGHYPILKQSWSEKNPNRLYLSCGDNQKCKFFRWADEPVIPENFKDPLAVHDWLRDQPPVADLGESYNGKVLDPAPRAPIFGESVQDFQRRMQQVKVGFNPANFEKDYVPLHKDVIERGKLGLF